MSEDAIVEFVQSRFSTPERFPDSVGGRAPVPAWLARFRGEAPRLFEGDALIRVDNRPKLAESIRVEGAPNLNQPLPAGDGTTADALAYYLPFHFYRQSWGIYILAGGVWSLARRLEGHTTVPESSALDFAYRLLLDHERLHFIAEYAASRIEIVTAQGWYLGYFGDRDAALHEEALANARALETSKHTRAFRSMYQAAIVWMHNQGPGYRDFLEWVGDHYTYGERRSAAFMTIAAATANRRTLSPDPTRTSEYAFHPAEFLFLDVSQSPPVYVVVDSSTPWLRVAKPFPKSLGLQVFTHSKDHKPPHIHIDCPPGTFRTRYRWPDLTPLEGDPSLRGNEEERLRQYISEHRIAIDRRIKVIPWE